MAYAPISTGEYLIRNVGRRTFAAIEDSEDRTPLTAIDSRSSDYVRWNVIHVRNGYYNFQNVGSNTYANAGIGATVGDSIGGVHYRPQRFMILESPVHGQYIIATDGSRLRWTVTDDQPDTPITLTDTSPGANTRWIFERIG
ncbi:hypothetical protein AMATHDRAFT_42909 [Amanita thiersii Skay4041]|uniref:Ricin B lectin domain-containing protein n=1 Tax=Amanita thiersii Skay4041 TaxID=703135 RepID=A0A2A9NIF1_9AGAR|nr:hypothetical protein AMATHDRAFT_42909 [Amanita thiersii Skay4041]